MKISKSKTEYSCIHGENDDQTVKMEDKNVLKVKQFKYLKLTVQESGDCKREVKKRLQTGWNGWRKVSGIICHPRLPTRVKGKVYSLVVRPARVFGLETVSTKKQLEEMEVAEMKMLRFAMGVTRKNKIRNEYSTSGYRKGRTVRNEDEGGQTELVRTYNEERPRICRKKKRRRFLNIMKEDIREVGEKEMDVENRMVWRKIISCANP